MRRLVLIIAGVVLLPLSGINIATAQDGGPPQFRPVELWACSYRDGKDRDDMEDVYDDLREGATDAPYAAWHLTPYFAGSLGAQIDFIYLGAWGSGAAMGPDVDSYLENVDSTWDETVDCQGLMFASNRVQATPEDNDGSGNFVLTVSDCSVEDGRTAAQAMGAMNRFNDYRVANGITIPTFVWFPVFGGGDAEFDFKLVNAFANVTGVGDWFQWSVDNAAYRVSGDLMDGLVSCDESRMYLGSTIMNNMN